MSKTENTPDFFIVGAPKCGTTALDSHLHQHPEIFMAKKELHYFGSDIGMIQEPLDEEKYLSQFEKALSSQLKGESSVWYLYSQNAAKQIKAFNPEAKAIILLRKPSEMLPSLHSQFLYNGIETITDFDRALHKDAQRVKGVKCAMFENRPRYLDSVMYYEQVKRFLEIFGEQQLLVLLHEEMQQDFIGAYQKVLHFLGVHDRSFSPKISEVNTRRAIKSVRVHLIEKNPPRWLKKVFRFIVPFKSVRHSMMENVERINVSTASPKVISESSKKLINDHVKDDVLKLQQLLELDLQHWLG